MDQGSNKNHSPAYNFTPTVTKFCVMWEGLSLPHDTKFGNCRCKIVDSRSFHSWSLIHGLRWSGLIKVGPGFTLRLLMFALTLGDSLSFQWDLSTNIDVFIYVITIIGSTQTIFSKTLWRFKSWIGFVERILFKFEESFIFDVFLICP